MKFHVSYHHNISITLRYSDEDKPNIKPFTFIPFGVGPSNCIGKQLLYKMGENII